jgi:hypothetical protein
VTNWNDGTIHDWNGGDCPVHPKTMVEYWMRRNGASECNAGNLVWDHDETAGDIIAFRVVERHVEPKVIWVNEYEGGIRIAYDSEDEAKEGAGSGAIRIAVKYVEVRE